AASARRVSAILRSSPLAPGCGADFVAVGSPGGAAGPTFTAASGAFSGCALDCAVASGAALSATVGGLAWGGAAPSASLRMISLKRSLDQVSQCNGAPAACGWALSGGALRAGVVGAGADPVAWVSRRTTDL